MTEKGTVIKPKVSPQNIEAVPEKDNCSFRQLNRVAPRRVNPSPLRRGVFGFIGGLYVLSNVR